jgi:hypothetical protein
MRVTDAVQPCWRSPRDQDPLGMSWAFRWSRLRRPMSAARFQIEPGQTRGFRCRSQGDNDRPGDEGEVTRERDRTDDGKSKPEYLGSGSHTQCRSPFVLSVRNVRCSRRQRCNKPSR